MPIEWILILVFCIITSILYLTLPTLLIFWIPVIGYLAYRSSIKKNDSTYLNAGVMFIPVRHQDCNLKSEEEAEKIQQI